MSQEEFSVRPRSVEATKRIAIINPTGPHARSHDGWNRSGGTAREEGREGSDGIRSISRRDQM
jgi:hypothetical protein